MKTLFFFSDAGEDILLGKKDLERPFLLDPFTAHPFLTLHDYFTAIEQFLIHNHASLESILGLALNKKAQFNHIQKVIIRSEKHGAFYHLARIDIFIDNAIAKFGLCIALSSTGKSTLNREFKTLCYLVDHFQLPYLPRPYLKAEEQVITHGKKEEFTFILSQWLDGYNERHLSSGSGTQDQRICIWDTQRGRRYAPQQVAELIFRSMGKILTLYYDTKRYFGIYPWHQAAADFVLKNTNETLEVRLTTARAYEPLAIFRAHPDPNPLIALFYFFLNLGIRLRLDKAEGVGEVIWANKDLLKSGIEGFMDALKLMHKEGRYRLGNPEEFISTIKSFSPKELIRAFSPLMGMYETENPDEFQVIKKQIKGTYQGAPSYYPKHSLISSSAGVLITLGMDISKDALSGFAPSIFINIALESKYNSLLA